MLSYWLWPRSATSECYDDPGFARALCFPARPSLARPKEEHVDADADHCQNQNASEELRHVNERGIVCKSVAEPDRAADHFCAHSGEKAENRANHEPYDDHRHSHGDADLQKNLRGRGAE